MSARKKANLAEMVLLSTGTAIGLALLLLVPGALLLFYQLLPMDAISMLAAVSAALALFLSTVIFCRNKKTAAATAGLTLAGYLILVFLIGLCFCGGEILGMSLLWQLVSAAAGTALGIMVAIRKRSRRKKRAQR